MLTRRTKRTILEAVRRGLSPSHASAAVPVAIEHPEYSQYNIQPVARWRYMDVDPPEAPYTLITLAVKQPDVSEEEGISDMDGGRVLDVERLDNPDPDEADLRVTKGRPVRDTISLMTTADGGVSLSKQMNGETPTPEYLTADDRANAVCRAVRKYLLETFPTKPLDPFDSDGKAITTRQIYGDTLTPSVNVTPVEGRGVTAMPGELSETDAQYNTAVNLHYFELSESYEYVPERVGVEPQVTTDTRP